ncbi:MAG TPA: hypothetical protein VFL91_29750, partial [Thermomicrobiales bacterium]|nr:hypothetical protein [Thermomicrobiales bacterium]
MDRRTAKGEKLRRALSLGRPLRLVWRSGPGWAAASGALMLVQGLLPLVGLYTLKLVVDVVAADLAA